MSCVRLYILQFNVLFNNTNRMPHLNIRHCLHTTLFAYVFIYHVIRVMSPSECRNMWSGKSKVKGRIWFEIGKGMQSNTTLSIKMYLMAIIDNYMLRPLLAIFRVSSRELKVYYLSNLYLFYLFIYLFIYLLCAHVVQRSLHTTLLHNK